MKNIIVTTDLSEESVRAFPLALELAGALKCNLTLLAIVEDPAQAAFAYAMDFPVYPDPRIHEQVIKKVKEDLAQMAQKHFAGATIETVVSEAIGSVAIEICEVAKKRAASMIVISSHGRSGLQRILVGSVTERVIREAPCPVLVVPHR